MSERIGYVGLGIMGRGMARNLLKAGFSVEVWNRTASRMEELAVDGAKPASSPAEVAANCDIIITCVSDTPDVEAVILGENGVLQGARAGSLVIDCSTISPQSTRDIAAKLAEKGVHFLDAPVSGGSEGAAKGTLTIMVGGDTESFARGEPVMQAYAARMVHIGGPGAGQTTKMVNQICIAGVLQGLSEAVRFAQAADLDLDMVFEAISGGAAQSWQMVNRWNTMAKDEFNFGFAVDWMRKDLGLTLEEARSNGATLPVTALVDQFYAEVQAMGGGRQDTSSLVRRLAKR